MKKKCSLARASTIVVAMLITMPASLGFAQAAQHDHAQQAQPQKEGMKMGEMKMDAAMMAEMAAKKKANTDRITSLMAQAKSASGDEKVAALADVIAVLLEERTGHERALRVDDVDDEEMKACAGSLEWGRSAQRRVIFRTDAE